MTNRNGTAPLRCLAQAVCILMTLAGSWSTTAHAESLVSNLSGRNFTISVMYSMFRWSQPIRTGSVEGGYTLDSVALYFANHITSPESELLSVTIRESIPSTGRIGHPGAVRYTLTNPSSIRLSRLNEFTAPAGAVLEPDTRYHIVVEYSSPEHYVSWSRTHVGMDPGFAEGWDVPRHAYVQRRSVLGSWLDDWTIEQGVVHTIVVNGAAGPAEPRPTVSVERMASPVDEGEDAQFRVTRTEVTTGVLAVSYGVSETGDTMVPGEAGARSVEFGDGVTEMTVTVPTVEDTVDEPDSTLTLTLTDDATYDFGAASSAEVTVEDNDDAPSVTIADAGAVSEGGTLAFPVSLSHPSAGDVAVSYTLGGTAAAGDDYTDGGSGTVTFAAGDTDRTISLTTVDDSADEADETVEVTLTDGATYDLGTPSTATGTITDNDLQQVTVAAETATVTEGAQAVFVLTRAGVVTGGLAVTFAVTGGGSVLTGAPPTTASFGAGLTTVQVPLATADDTTDEPDATLTLTLTDGATYDLGAASSAEVTVEDNDAAPRATIADAGSVTEGGTLAFPVSLSHPSAGDVAVSYTLDGTATAGNDYTDGGSGTVTFAAGVTERTISLATVDDSVDEADKTVDVTLTDGATYDLGTPSTATGTITDNDLPQVTVASEMATVTEGARAVFVVRRAGMVTEELAVTFTVAGGDAVLSGAPPTTATFRAGRTTVRVSLATVDDTTDEPDAALTLTLTDGATYDLGAASMATVTVEDNDAVPRVTIADAGAVSEGRTLAFPVRLSHPSAEDITVSYTLDGTATADDDYTDGGSGMVTFAAGDTERTIPLATVKDSDDETDETVEATLTDADDPAWELGTPSTATGTITDDDLPLVTVAAETATVTEGADAVFVLTRTGVVTDELAVTFAVTGGDTVLTGAPPTAASFGAGLTTVRLLLATTDDTADEPDAALTLTLNNGVTYDLGMPSAATVTVEDNDAAPRVTIADAESVAEGGTLAFPVRLSHPSAGDVTVSYTLDGTATAGDDYTDGGAGTVTFAAGDMQQTISLATVDDSVDEADETVEVTLTDADDPAYDLGTPSTAMGAITDDDLPLTTVAAERSTVTEGAEAVFVLTRAGVVTEELAVTFTVTGGDAVLSGTPPTAATFGVGRTTVRLPLATTDDTTDEPNAALTLTLTDGAAYDLGAPSAATVTVADNDAAPTVTIADAGSVAEGGTLAFPVRLSHPSAGDVTVSYTLDGTATAGDDYTDGGSGMVTFAAGDTEQTISLATVGDSVDEEDETVEVTLTDGATYDLGTPSTATGTIANNALPELSVSDESAVEGDTGDSVTIQFTVTLDPTAVSPVTVEWATADGTAQAGTDYTAGSGSLRFDVGDTTRTVSVPVTGDNMDEPNETFTVTLSNAVGATLGRAVGTGTIVDDEDAPRASITDAGAMTEGETLVFPVRLSHPSATPVTVRCVLGGMATRNEDYTDGCADTVMFPAGVTTQTILLTTMDDGLDETDETVVVTLIDPDDAAYDLGTPSSATGMIMDNDLPAVTAAAETPAVTEGAEAVFVLTRAGLLSDELTVAFTVAGGDAVLADVPPTGATFGAGEDTARVTLATEDDLVDEADADVVLTLRSGAAWTPGDPPAATVTVRDDDDLPAVTVTALSGRVPEGNAAAASVRITEGEAAQFEARRTGDVSAALRVVVEVSERGADMVPAAQEGTRQVTFEPGASTTVLQVTTADDGIAEPDSRVTVAVSQGDGSYEVGDPGSATVTVADAGGGSVLAQGRHVGAASLLRRHVQRFSQLTSDVALGRLEGNARTSTGDVRVDRDGVAATGDVTVDLPSGWDGWASFRYSRLGGSLDGDVWDVYAGADYLGADGLAAYGALIGYEPGLVTSDGVRLEAGHVQLGVYGARRLSDALTLDGALGWGRGEGDLALVGGSYPVTASYRSERFVVRGDLTGDFGWGGDNLRVEPQIGLLYAQENLDAFTDSLGGATPSDRLWLARVGLGPKLTWSRAGSTTHGKLRVNLDAHNLEAPGDDREEVSASLELGHRWRIDERSSFDIAVSFDGLGSDWFASNSFGLTYEIQFGTSSSRKDRSTESGAPAPESSLIRHVK